MPAGHFTYLTNLNSGERTVIGFVPSRRATNLTDRTTAVTAQPATNQLSDLTGVQGHAGQRVPARAMSPQVIQHPQKSQSVLTSVRVQNRTRYNA